MTNEERDKLINSVLPDTVKGQSRPAENLNPDMPYSTDFPQLINKDPASADVFNLINRQLLSNDKNLNDNKADKTYVDKKVSDLVNGAPEQLDTLQELSKALNNDKNYAVTVNNALAEKLGKREKAESAETANYAKAADTANKLQGYPLAPPGSGNTFGKVPVVSTGGVLEIGKSINFHRKNGDEKDYLARIEVNDDGTLSFNNSLRANISGTAGKAFADIDGIKLVGIYNNAAAHNALFRGKDLTNYFNSGRMSKAIANGTFENIFIGDYINKNITVDGVDYTVKWEVAHLDYFLHSGNTECTTHHVLLFPSKTIQTNVPMNDTNTAVGGYVATKMWTETIPKYVEGITNAFGSAHVLTHKELLTKAINADAPSGAGAGWMGSSTEWDWYDTLVNIPSEPMIYGGRVFGSSAYDVGNKERQLQIFRFKKFSEGRLWFWLQAVASASRFADAAGDGYATYHDAPSSYPSGGIRPYFLLK